jgi:predicted ATPase
VVSGFSRTDTVRLKADATYASKRLQAGRDDRQNPRRVIVTGGPGAGKTALLTALAGRGYACVPDSARAIIQDRVRRGSSARPDAPEFAAAILRMDIERYRQAPTDVEVVFFDRAVPDALCMLNDLGLLSLAEAEQRAAEFPYWREVFVAPPWQEIYTTDSERDQQFADSIRVHRRASNWYAALRFELIELPRAPVDDRCGFVLERLRMTP